MIWCEIQWIEEPVMITDAAAGSRSPDFAFPGRLLWVTPHGGRLSAVAQHHKDCDTGLRHSGIQVPNYRQWAAATVTGPGDQPEHLPVAVLRPSQAG